MISWGGVYRMGGGQLMARVSLGLIGPNHLLVVVDKAVLCSLDEHFE